MVLPSKQLALSLIALVFALGTTSTAQADMGAVMIQNSINFNSFTMPSVLASQTIADTARRDYERKWGKSGSGGTSNAGSQPGAKAQANVSPDAPAFVYTPNAAISATMRAEAVASVKRQYPGNDAMLDNYFAGDVLKKFEAIMRANGANARSISDVIAAYALIMYDVAHQHEPSAAEVRSVRLQFANFLSRDHAAFKSNESKQKMAEYLAYNAILIAQADVDLRRAGTAQAKNAVRQTARKSAKGIGFDVDAVVLTANGFAPRK